MYFLTLRNVLHFIQLLYQPTQNNTTQKFQNFQKLYFIPFIN
jgi:hypothetical protein